MTTRIAFLLTAAILLAIPAARADDLLDQVEHGHADSNGVKIHYAAMGEGPLMVLIHGFPDFWYSWRKQMPALAEAYKVVAIDQRGYNDSGQPEGQENYSLDRLAEDVTAVVKHHGAEKAVIVGHDWGGMVAWWTAMFHPEIVDRLIVLNLPHPKCLSRELVTNPAQQRMSNYARQFQKDGFHEVLNPTFLSMMVSEKDLDAQPIYEKAFENSSIEAMLAYYKENFPAEPYQQDPRDMPQITVPVLQFHGLADVALHANGLNNTWDWIDAPWTLVTVPNKGHFVHHEAPELINENILSWLEMNRPEAEEADAAE